MSIHYKFKNTKDYDAIKFDGVYISAGDLKSIIAQQKKLANSELHVENEETKEAYTDDQMIPKNTNVIVSRLPFANSNKRARIMANQHHTNNGNASGNTNPNNNNHHHNHHHHNNHHNNHHNHHHHHNNNNNHHHHRQPPSTSTNDPLSSNGSAVGGGREALELVNTKNMTEEERMKYIRLQSTKDFDPSRYARGGRGGGHRPGGRGGAGGRITVGPGYTCRKCGIPGHSIYDCRMSAMHKVKRSSGIPRDFLMKVDSKEKGALMTPSGEYAVPFIDREAYNNPKVEKAPFFEDGTPPSDGTPSTTAVNGGSAKNS